MIGGARKRPSAVVVWTALDVCAGNGGKRPAVVSRRAALDVCVDSGCKQPPRLINAVALDVCGPRPPKAARVCAASLPRRDSTTSIAPVCAARLAGVQSAVRAGVVGGVNGPPVLVGKGISLPLLENPYRTTI
ncbi:MAG: hypothetical protein ACLPZR_24570 [Solirubrobacteraceae bacterium]